MRVTRFGRATSALAAMAMIAGCGGGGGAAGGSGVAVVASGASTPTPAADANGNANIEVAGCSLRERQDWAFAQLKEWYLFPDTLPASLDPSGYSTVQAYVDALTATARGQRRDRNFTYVTSIKSEDAYYNSGSNAGFGVRLSYETAGRVFVSESFEGAPALAAGIDRGAEILAVGTSPDNLQNVSDLIAANGAQGVTDALGPATAGTSRVLRVSTGGIVSTVTLTKADYTLTPVSNRYGAKVISEGGKQYGYVNLRTFISTADPALRDAFAQFRAAGVTDIIVDLRYNGGGLTSIAELVGDLIGANRNATDQFDYMMYRSDKQTNNTTRYFKSQPQAIAPTRVAFIGANGTASASELVINAMRPYLRANAALIGANTYGKPVGQIAIDKSTCDDRLRVIAFSLKNADRDGDYYDGLASKMETSCQAGDDLSYPMGDPREASTRSALDFLEGKSCTRIGAGGGITTQSLKGPRELIVPADATTAQRETPGLF
ncbi:MAG: peptidase S41 [Proteobacteria bacterium]|nr:peptidase S41 [Pseudomonadota bacterium]